MATFLLKGVFGGPFGISVRALAGNPMNQQLVKVAQRNVRDVQQLVPTRSRYFNLTVVNAPHSRRKTRPQTTHQSANLQCGGEAVITAVRVGNWPLC